MSTKDFNLDLVEVSKSNTGASARITSYSLCTPGCITGVLMDVNSKVLDAMFMSMSVNSVTIV
ncbi:MAG: gallidermin/nisin family lantibiotic [Turicibacter sp.]